MKIQSLLLSILLLSTAQALHADGLATKNASTPNTAASDYFRKITPEFLYGYTDFNFNSTTGTNFNRYKGHSNLYSAGADHISLGSSMMAGVYYFAIDTTVNAKFLLTPGDVTKSEQTIHNNTIFAHLLKIFTPEIYLDLAGGFGYNNLNTLTQIETTPKETVAQARNINDNWFTSVNAIYRKTWSKYMLRANLGVLYSEIDSGNYDYVFPASNTVQPVQPLTNRATLVLENAELGYFVTPKFMPFINGGGIIVAQFSNSRPLLSASSTINGSLPQLNMNKSGFRVGGGFSYTYKNVTMRLEEKYYNAGGTFQSYQTLAAFEYQFN